MLTYHQVFCDINLRAVSWEMLTKFTSNICSDTLRIITTYPRCKGLRVNSCQIAISSNILRTPIIELNIVITIVSNDNFLIEDIYFHPSDDDYSLHMSGYDIQNYNDCYRVVGLWLLRLTFSKKINRGIEKNGAYKNSVWLNPFYFLPIFCSVPMLGNAQPLNQTWRHKIALSQISSTLII